MTMSNIVVARVYVSMVFNVMKKTLLVLLIKLKSAVMKSVSNLI